jgi:hypothetical protein
MKHIFDFLMAWVTESPPFSLDMVEKHPFTVALIYTFEVMAKSVFVGLITLVLTIGVVAGIFACFPQREAR